MEAEARCLRAGRLPPRRQRAGAVELPDEGAWDFRTTDRLTTVTTTKTPKPAPTHYNRPCRKIIEEKGTQRVLLVVCLADKFVWPVNCFSIFRARFVIY